MIEMVNLQQVFYHDGRVGTRYPVVFEVPRDEFATDLAEKQDPDTLAKGGDGG